MASYRFTLRTPSTAIIFGSDKVRNWQDIEPELVQHEVYRGIFREFSNTFEFIGDIRKLIIETLDTYGIDAKIYLLVEVGNDNKEKWSFEPISDELLANLSNCEISENAVSLDFADNDFTSKFFNSHDKKVNLDITENFEGNEITPVPLNDVYLHDRTLVFNSQIKTTNDVTRHNFYRLPVGDNTDAKITIPCKIKYKSDGNFKNINAGKNLPEGAREFYLKSEKDRIIKINYNLNFKIKGDGAFSATRWQLILKHVKTTPVEYVICQSTGYGGSYPNVIRDAEYITINESFENTYIINEGDSLELYLHFGVIGHGVVFLFLDATDIDIFGTSNEYFNPTSAKALLPIELCTQLLHIYTGVKLPFYSNYFGRTELGYSVDGSGAYLAIMNGKMARGFPWELSQFNISFKEVFEELNKIKNLGAVIENIGGNYRFRIDKYEDLINNNIVIDIGKNFKDLSRTTDENAMISEISVGYKDLIIEEVNGLFSYNGEINYVTPLQIEGKKLDILSKWIASDIAIEVTRRQHYTLFPSKDWKFDKDIFIIDCKSQKEFLNGEWIKLDLPLLPITNEDYETIQGIYEPNRTYNLNLSPKHNFLNWQKEIKSSLLQKTGDTIKIVKKANNPDLVTKKTGEQTIIESSDVIISQLENPYNTPDLIMIGESQLTRAQYNLIRNNPYGLICFESKGNKIYARVKNISFAINRKTCNFELIRANY